VTCCFLVGVAEFDEPAASSSRSKLPAPRTAPLCACDLHRQCICVPVCTPVFLPVVTQFVTHPVRQGDNPGTRKRCRTSSSDVDHHGLSAWALVPRFAGVHGSSGCHCASGGAAGGDDLRSCDRLGASRGTGLVPSRASTSTRTRPTSTVNRARRMSVLTVFGWANEPGVPVSFLIHMIFKGLP
jgi:hypothetical protein